MPCGPGLGEAPAASTPAGSKAPAEVEAAAVGLERQGFTLLGVGAGLALGGAVFSGVPMLLRLAFAAGGVVATVFGVKNLAEGEGTRQAGAQLGLTVGRCVAQAIVGKSKIPI